jgi:hypothetical protein
MHAQFVMLGKNQQNMQKKDSQLHKKNLVKNVLI